MKVDFDVRPALPNVRAIAGELVDEAKPPAPLLPPAPAAPIEVPLSAVFTGGVYVYRQHTAKKAEGHR